MTYLCSGNQKWNQQYYINDFLEYSTENIFKKRLLPPGVPLCTAVKPGGNWREDGTMTIKTKGGAFSSWPSGLNMVL